MQQVLRIEKRQQELKHRKGVLHQQAWKQARKQARVQARVQATEPRQIHDLEPVEIAKALRDVRIARASTLIPSRLHVLNERHGKEVQTGEQDLLVLLRRWETSWRNRP